MKRKKMIYSILLVLLIGFILFFYQAFNGNPISKAYSKNVLGTYLNNNYPSKEFRIDDGVYDFKFSQYIFEVVEIGSIKDSDGGLKKYEFNVSGFIKPVVNWDGIYYANLDEPLMEKLGQEAAKEIEGVLKEEVPSVHSVEIQIEVLKGKLDPATSWNKNLSLEKPIQMHIVLDSTNQTTKDVFDDAKKIQNIIESEGYKYDYVNINGNGFDNKYSDGKDDRGYVKFAISFEKDTKLQLNDVEEFDQ
ncbi:hypothetical protein [Fredinandcohnia quinoae]|uniref:Uncharacterized protein n=1 Tax=Fredinandcohnia quinoae TaxID=2918902 RepID=A0AAW5E256_9BACI|nr:hypothetical protein [Fredinandcohnia sp. SECRCQ15]MCH1625634.1 hypothetical protein [Fredinandcohnia sp. SECRCQ15]